MQRITLLVGLLLVLGAAPAAAQTRVTVSVGIGTPHLAGYVVIGDRYPRHRYVRYRSYHPRPPLVVVERVRYYGPRRVIVVPRRHHRHHHRWQD